MKIYICKSNNCDPDTLIHLRAMCRKENIDVLEHTGGQYDPLLIHEAQMIIIIPPDIAENKTSIVESALVGKGLFSQANEFNGPKFLALRRENMVYFKDVTKVEVYDTNDWKIRYGKITTDIFEYYRVSEMVGKFGVVSSDDQKMAMPFEIATMDKIQPASFDGFTPPSFDEI